MGAHHASPFPTGGSVPRKRPSGLLGRAPLFVLRAADESQGEHPAQDESNETHPIYSSTDW
jgi:hypothetical protein